MMKEVREDGGAMTSSLPPFSVTAAFPVVHEEVVTVWHRHSRLRAVVAIHSTVRGPALGGCRFRSYPTLDAAVTEACSLSEAMTLKSAVAGLPFGGGKSVLIGDPETTKTEELLCDFAAVLNRLEGRYITAEDVGTTQKDMDTLKEHSEFVTGTSLDRGGSGDPSPMTAYGVLCAMEAGGNHLWDTRDLSGKHAAISGLGKVGSELARLLMERGCKLTVADVNHKAVESVAAIGHVEIVGTEQIHTVHCDIFAPCALGGALNERTVGELHCALVVGAANNQLATPQIAEDLQNRDVTYIPDFVANAGGVINIAQEHLGYNEHSARARVLEIYTTTETILRRSMEHKTTPLDAALALAEERLTGTS
jgi:glutamate dehydrogenase/leucine dehydrogenase